MFKCIIQYNDTSECVILICNIIPLSDAIQHNMTEPSQKPRLLEQLRSRMRLKHLSPRTEEVYVSWVKRFIFYHGKRHPKEMGAEEISSFLSHLAEHDGVSASTQNVALLFLYREVLGQEFPQLYRVVRARRMPGVPFVPTREEVRRALMGCAASTIRCPHSRRIL